ncbi:MAG: phosphoribosylaminoimidazolesuccinocarboxamide synthase [Planctomycetota bacterium]
MPPPADALSTTELDLRVLTRGKVRDVYALPPVAAGSVAGSPAGSPAGLSASSTMPRVLIVASDRLSAFDVVLPTPIPGKGRMLTEIAAFWLRFIERTGVISTHLLSTRAEDIPRDVFAARGTKRDALEGRVTIGRACRVIPVEFVVRGYLEGSGWRDYQRTGKVCGLNLPAGLSQCARLDAPLFTPATKAEQGDHDQNIDFERASGVIDAVAGPGWGERLRDVSLAIYNAARDHAEARGMILADTKFEFGLPIDASGEPTGEDPILIDEALTPDSSRFWSAENYAPGGPQPSFDKQFVREYLEGLVVRGLWDKTSPGPELPADIVDGVTARYTEARDRLLA